jgi:hypothetical protein
MATKITIAALEAEVKTWSDQVSAEVLCEAVTATYARPKINRSYDIPYIAGYSKDGKTIFIDRHMPRTMKAGRGLVRTDRFIVLHEVVEKALLDEVRLHYLHAHQIALRTEQAAVQAAGLKWRDYDQFIKANEKHIEDERLKRVPAALDLTPYRDEDDFEKLQALIRVIHNAGK